ncbi:MAG: ATP-grasp domain-containing protein [Desulfobacterales bacterium]|nr:ATP-grasp domain-containing protein [Desulfobacterales bacterium]
MNKILMLLGASHFYAPIIREIQKLGTKVVVTDRDPEAEGFRYADCCEVVDITDFEKSLEVARKYRIDGIMAINDFGVRTASYIANELELVGIDMESAIASCDKGKQRERWREVEVPQPVFEIITDLESATVAAEQVGYPLVIKPTDSGGASRGISVVKRISELEWAIDFAGRYARTGEIILENYIEGIEATAECLIWNGHVEILAVSDKVKPIDTKYRVATSLNYTSFFPDEVMAQIHDVVPKAIRALGIEQGAAHIELVMRPDGRVWMVEMAARPGGGHIFHTIVPYVSGVNMPQEFAKILTGIEPEIKPKYQKGAVYRFFDPPKGRLKTVLGLEKAGELSGVLALGIQVQPGAIIGDTIGQHHRPGYIVTGAETRDEAVEIANAVEQTVIFEIESKANPASFTNT